jgi:hypothetical protein
MKAVRLMLWLSGTLGITFAGLQIVGLALFFTVGRVACKPVIIGDGKAKHSMQLEIEPQEPMNHWDALLGDERRVVRSGFREGCSSEWTDEDPIMMFNNHGPKNGTEFVFWKAFTLHGRTTLGRYIADLWTGVSIGSGGALGSRVAWCEVDNIRLIERLPPPQPAPPGFRTVVPGECVFANLEDSDDRVVGRFWIELPAPRSVRLFTQVPYTTNAQLRERLTYDDLDVPDEMDPVERRSTGRFWVSHPGFHKVIISRVDPVGTVPPEEVRKKGYTLQVEWGISLSYGCSPRLDIHETCF